METFTIDLAKTQQQDLPTESSAELPPTTSSISRLIRSLENTTRVTSSIKTNETAEKPAQSTAKPISQDKAVRAIEKPSDPKEGQVDQTTPKPRSFTSTIPVSGLKRSKALWRVSDLYEYTTQPHNEAPTGRVHDFYFDEKTWAIRYLVVDLGEWQRDTKEWVLGQKVVVPAKACGYPQKKTKSLPLTLPKKQIEFLMFYKLIFLFIIII